MEKDYYEILKKKVDPMGFVRGNGKYAVLAHCKWTDAWMFPSLKRARGFLKQINEVGCCPTCEERHEIIKLEE